MTIKEKPFIDAASDAGPLPRALFSNSFAAGLFSLVMCAVFGGTLVLFGAFGRGVVDPLDLFEAVRWGAIAGLVVGGAALTFIFVAASFQKDEGRVDRLLFVLGGVFGIAALAVADWLYLENLRAWLSTVGPLVEKVV